MKITEDEVKSIHELEFRYNASQETLRQALSACAAMLTELEREKKELIIKLAKKYNIPITFTIDESGRISLLDTTEERAPDPSKVS